jgi:hypothetical protein
VVGERGVGRAVASTGPLFRTKPSAGHSYQQRDDQRSMMFEAFRRSFSEDAELSVATQTSSPSSNVLGWNALVDLFGGVSFERGLYRVVRRSYERSWNARIAEAFPEFGHRVTCFAFDWLGRVFAVDPNRLESGQPGIVMFDPGAGEALMIPCSLVSFHEEELIESRDAALAGDFHERWLESGGIAPRYDQCIGYQTPLFLGGADEVGNLEMSDVDVYWHLTAQLILKTRNMPVGTPIRTNLS